MLEHYRKLVAGTNIDPRSMLSTDYFNHFATVIMLFNMAANDPVQLREIDKWKFVSYSQHFSRSELDFASLAVKAYEFSPVAVREQFDAQVERIRLSVERARLELHRLLKAGDKEKFAELARIAAAELQQMVDTGAAIVHGYASLKQDAIDKLF